VRIEGNARKKLQDLFVDAKVPRERRRRIPVVVDAEGKILWVVGLRRGAEARLAADTKTAVVIRVTTTAEK
jgi:tRNA(Ile)-lysidine synthase